MKPEIKNQWVKDLRDPARKQTEGHLRNKWGGQCCLDVLCEQAVTAGIIDPPVLDASLGDIYVYYWDGGRCQQFETLPDPVIEWADLPDGNPDVEFEDPDFEYDKETPDATEDFYGNKQFDSNCLAELNDGRHFDFPTIANIIENSDL